MQNKKIIALIIVIVSFFILTYRLTASFIFHPDFARDMFDITRISQGKFMLIGPKLTFGGIYSGPYYYYLLLPALLLSNYNISAVLFLNTFLFALALGFFYFKASQKLTTFRSLLATAVILFSPLYLIASRNPSNAFTYIPFLLILLTIIYFDSIQKPKHIILIGFFAGIIATFHVVTACAIVVVAFLVFVELKNKKDFFWFPIGSILAFLPLVLFEVKHNFIMLKNTFIDKSYLLWINNKNIPGGIIGKKNPFENFFFISQSIEKFLVINPLIMFIIATISQVKEKLTRKDTVLLAGSIAALITMALLMRFQFIYHYLFAAVLLILFTVVVLITKSKLYVLLLILLAFELAYFPKEIYIPSWRTPAPYQKAVSYVLENQLIARGENFNVIQITEPDLLSPNGFEYRFFLQQQGYRPDSEFIYKTSRKLLIFSEKPEYDIKKLDTWESREFGTEYIAKAKKYSAGAITIYVAEK